eukprot:g3201.t1
MIVAAAETELAKGAADQKQEAIAGVFLLEVARTHFPLLCRFQCPGVTTWTELLGFFLETERDIDADSSPKSLMCGWDKFRKLFLVVDSETQEELDTDEAIAQLIVDAAEAAPTSSHSQLDDTDRQRAADEGAEEQNEQTNAASSAVGARYQSATTQSCTSRDVLIVQRVFDFKEVWETQDAMLAAFSIFAVPEEFCLAHKERKARARQWFLILDDFEIPVLMDLAASRDPAAVEGLMRSTPLLLEYFIKERRCHNFFDWVRCPRSWSYQSVVEFFLDTIQEDLWDTGFERTWGNHFMLDDEMGLRCSYYTHLLEAAVRKCETNICGGADSGDAWQWPVGFDPFFAASRAVLDKVYYCRKTSFHVSGRFATVSTADIPAQDLQDEAAAQLHRCLCFEVLLLILLDFERQKRLPPSTPQSKCAALVIFMALRIGAQRAIERAAREEDAAKVKKFSAASARSSMMKLLSAGADANASPPEAICPAWPPLPRLDLDKSGFVGAVFPAMFTMDQDAIIVRRSDFVALADYKNFDDAFAAYRKAQHDRDAFRREQDDFCEHFISRQQYEDYNFYNRERDPDFTRCVLYADEVVTALPAFQSLEDISESAVVATYKCPPIAEDNSYYLEQRDDDDEEEAEADFDTDRGELNHEGTEQPLSLIGIYDVPKPACELHYKLQMSLPKIRFEIYSVTGDVVAKCSTTRAWTQVLHSYDSSKCDSKSGGVASRISVAATLLYATWCGLKERAIEFAQQQHEKLRESFDVSFTEVGLMFDENGGCAPPPPLTFLAGQIGGGKSQGPVVVDDWEMRTAKAGEFASAFLAFPFVFRKRYRFLYTLRAVGYADGEALESCPQQGIGANGHGEDVGYSFAFLVHPITGKICVATLVDADGGRDKHWFMSRRSAAKGVVPVNDKTMACGTLTKLEDLFFARPSIDRTAPDNLITDAELLRENLDDADAAGMSAIPIVSGSESENARQFAREFKLMKRIVADTTFFETMADNFRGMEPWFERLAKVMLPQERLTELHRRPQWAAGLRGLDFITGELHEKTGDRGQDGDELRKRCFGGATWLDLLRSVLQHRLSGDEDDHVGTEKQLRDPISFTLMFPQRPNEDEADAAE